MFVRVLWIVGVTVAASSTWGGLAYYLTPIPERPFSPLHDLYAPTGLVGQGFGIVGTLMVIGGVILYTARKRLRVLSRVGKLRDWLNFHIFLCLLGPFLIVLHTTFRFGGIVAISFWSMALVVGSGVFGRYVYSWIPKTISGHFEGAEEIRERLHALVDEVAARAALPAERLHTILSPPGDRDRAGARSAAPARPASFAPSPAHLTPQVEALSATASSIDSLFRDRRGHVHTAAPANGKSNGSETPRGAEGADRRERPREGRDRRSRPRQPGFFHAVVESAAYPYRRRRENRRFQRELSAAGVPESARSRILKMLDEERRVEQQLRVLKPFQRAFRYWHAFHLPLAFVMFAVLAIHVAVAVALGYTWIFAS